MEIANVTEQIANNFHITFSWYDHALFFLMLGFSTAIGIYFGFFGNKQSSAEEYLLGGKEMKVLPIAISLTASNISGITLLAVPTDVYRFGAIYWFYCINVILVPTVTYYVYLPVIYKLQITSVNEYLKLRFDTKIRLIASCLYAVSNFFFLPIVIYIPALAFAQATGVNLHLITPLVCGICIFYTTIGGLKAVVWTDALQFVVMVGAIIGVFYMGTTSVGGFGAIWDKAVEGKRVAVDFDLDPTKRDTLTATMIGTFFSAIAYMSINQGFVQKYLSMPKLQDVKKALVLFSIMTVIVLSLTVTTGLIMYARYSECDPFLSGQIKRLDEVLPYYVMDVASTVPGLAGLFLSGLFSAALSTLSATMNCQAGAIYEDFISPFMSKDITPKQVSNLLKLIVLIIGILSTVLVFAIEYMGSSILPINISLQGFTLGPLVGLFSLGMLFPRANAKLYMPKDNEFKRILTDLIFKHWRLRVDSASMGALFGILGSVLIMMFIIIGSQIQKASVGFAYEPKPLSIAGCGNITIEPHVVTKSMNSSMYDIFYLFKITHYYYAPIGALLVIFIGLVVSFLTIRKDDEPINPDVISPVAQFMIAAEKSKKVEYHSIKQALNIVTEK